MIKEQPAPTGVIASFRYAFSSPARLRKEVFGGLAVALALIPEVLSFSILAGLDPRVGLFSSVVMLEFRGSLQHFPLGGCCCVWGCWPVSFVV